MEFFTVVLMILWSFVGAGSFIYWWTKDYDFTADMVPVLFLFALIGPGSWLAGWIVHGGPFLGSNRVLFRKRS